jgi:polyisoprenyl-teichoic acid--peptidoglycan teichoic acid transferase
MKLRRTLLLGCLILSTILFVDGISVLARMNRIDRPRDPMKSELGRLEYREDQETPVYNGDSVNVLVLGLDEEEKRSDVVMLFNFLPGQSRVNVLSIARDTKVIARRRTVKFNALIGMGEESLVVDKTEQLTGLPVDYYITVNFKGFREVVDTLGGVELEVPMNMDYDDPEQDLHIHLSKGLQVLDGAKAEQFVRYRKGNRSREGFIDGDIGRIRMQQLFIQEFMHQKVKIKYLPKLYDIFYITKANMKTNIDMGDVSYYIRYMRKDLLQDVRTYTLPGESRYDNHVWYFVHDKKKTEALINAEFFR